MNGKITTNNYFSVDNMLWDISSVYAQCGTPKLSVMKCLSPMRTIVVRQGTVLVPVNCCATFC